MFQFDQVWPKDNYSLLNYAAHYQMLVQSVTGFMQLSPYQVVMTMDYHRTRFLSEQSDEFPM